MKHCKTFLLTVLSAFSISVLAGCSSQKEESKEEVSSTPSSQESIESKPSSILPSSEPSSTSTISSQKPQESSEEINKPLEIGDIVKEWTSTYDYEEAPITVGNGSGDCEIVEDFGCQDDCSVRCVLNAGNNNQGYISSEFLEEPYFDEEDAKNGDFIYMSVYAPSDSNLSSLQLQACPSISTNNTINGEVLTITDSNVETWIELSISFDSLETLRAIRLVYKAENTNELVTFYVDDIYIVLGEETVKTDYEYNDESLCQTYEDYFKVGTCLSANGLKNTELRKITKDNFNSLTAENEAKPERVLDQAACQELAKQDNGAVAITTAPFEKLYDFAEANGIGVRHHTFVWYSQTPNWFFTTDYTDNGPKASKELMLERMENFIRETLDTINARWPGLVYAIDVANEAIDQNTQDLRKSNNKWYDTVGEDFVYYAFYYANLYKEDYQKLYYNDFRYDYYSSICKYALESILGRVIEEGLIDGVGIQGHIDSNANIDNLIEDARLIHQAGLDCQITELDITNSDGNPSGLEKNKTVYKNLIKKILVANSNDETSIDAVILWGTTDNTSWRGEGQHALLFSSSYAKKPCYYGFLEAIDEIE